MSVSHYRADEVLNDALRGTATPHIWLHVADPGDDGTANVAQNGGVDIDRKSVDFGEPKNHETEERRLAENETEVVWAGADIDDGQEITHFSVWDADATGNVEFIAAVAEAKTIGSDGVKVEIGDLTCQLQVYEKPV